MVTNDPQAMSFLLMNALVCVVMLDIIVNIGAVWWRLVTVLLL